MTTPYDILGVDKSASDQDVKRAYRALSLKYHPDRNSTAEGASKMREINEAYDVLGDAQKRRQYDMQQQQQHHHLGRSFPFRSSSSSSSGGVGIVEMDLDASSMGDVFQMLFPGMMFPGAMGMGGGGIGVPEMSFFHMDPRTTAGNPFATRPPPPIQHSLTVTLEQAYVGCTLPIEIERWIMHGNLKVQEMETVYVDIPPGMDDSEMITLADKGNVLHDSCKGVVKVIIHVNNTTAFRRQGLNLIYCKTLTLKEALCGFSFELKHLNGKTLAMNNTQNVTLIKPRFQKVVPGYGMMRDKNVGSLVIEFDVQFPDTLTPEQVATLRDVL